MLSVLIYTKRKEVKESFSDCFSQRHETINVSTTMNGGNMQKNFAKYGLVVFVCLLSSIGCATMTSSPHMGFKGIEWQTTMERKDYVIMNNVEGQSNTLSILFGLVQIIDGSKLRLFWFIPFYEEKTARIPGSMLGYFPSTESRAYYDALTKNPEADVVLCKSVKKSYQGVPLVCDFRCVTYSGKAIKIKSDQ